MDSPSSKSSSSDFSRSESSGAYQVAAYITAYEDAEALNACLTAIKAQSYPVKQILIIDNSSQPLPLLPLLQADENILVQSHPENIGIAGGLQLGIAWAIEQNYDFLWLFDQDSTPNSGCLAALIQVYTQLATNDFKISITAPTAIDARTGDIVKPSLFLGDRFRGFLPTDITMPYECDAPITSGSLVWIEAAKQVPAPEIGLFIDGIDLDYGLRLRQAGFHNVISPAAKMYHRFGAPRLVQLFGKKKNFQLYSSLRYYYICRNHTYLELQHSHNEYWLTCCLRRLKYALLTLLKILALDTGSLDTGLLGSGSLDTSSKAEKMWACLIGTYHGFAGKLGKNW